MGSGTVGLEVSGSCDGVPGILDDAIVGLAVWTDCGLEGTKEYEGLAGVGNRDGVVLLATKLVGISVVGIREEGVTATPGALDGETVGSREEPLT
jgi:hypothetical protein